MKAQMLTDIRQIEIRQVDRPVVSNADDVLIKMEAVGVCGSDVHYYETGRIGSQVVQFPFIVGHECAGTIIQIGTNAEGVQPGDAVVIDPLIACGHCDQCRSGRVNTCRNQKFLGCPGQVAGCLCEYIVMPAACCYPTRNRITAEQAVLCEPFAIGLYAVQQAALEPDMKIGILGAGPIGLSVLEAAKAEGINAVYMTERIAERMQIARQAGAVWVGNPDQQDVTGAIMKIAPEGLDAVFECAGQQETLDQAVQILKPGGKLMIVGIPREDRVSFMPDQIRRKELTLVNVRRQNQCTQKAIDLLAEGIVNLDYMVTHRFDFPDTQAAFELVAAYQDGAVKALITMEKD